MDSLNNEHLYPSEPGEGKKNSTSPKQKKTQITTLCIATSMNATVALVCLYSPKVYIIVLHPDKNVRKLTMNSAAYKKYNSGPTSTHTASSTHKGADQNEDIPMQNVGTSTPSRSSYATGANIGSDSIALL